MKKSIRSLALMSVFVLATQPILADAGGNPAPHTNSALSWLTVAYTVLSCLGY